LVADEYCDLPQPAFDELERLTEQAVEVHLKMPSERQTTPGLHCYGCAKAAHCSAYPTFGAKPPLSARLLMVSKSKLTRLLSGDIANNTSFDDDDGPTPAMTFGIAVHETLEHCLSTDDPLGAATTFAEERYSSDVAERAIEAVRTELQECGADLTYRSQELTCGLTVPATGPVLGDPDGCVNVVFHIRIDATGQDENGDPVLVDFKTGHSINEVEHALYAVTAWTRRHRQGRPCQKVTVRNHVLAGPQSGKVIEEQFDAQRIASLSDWLTEIADELAAQNPLNPELQPSAGDRHAEAS